MLISKREEERIRLTHGIGEIDDKLTEVISENDELRARLELEPLPLVDVSKLRDRLHIHNQSYRAENDILRAEVRVFNNSVSHQIPFQSKKKIKNSGKLQGFPFRLGAVQ